MIVGHSFKSGGLRSRSKDLSLWVNLLAGLKICDVAGPFDWGASISISIFI